MSVFIFIIVLLALVVFHELGHFFAAKAVKMKVLEFGVGFPPKIFGKKFSPDGTEYSVNWIPFGGFVRIFGEDPKDMSEPGAFTQKTPLAQAFVLFAGPFANIVLAVLLSAVAFMVGATAVIDSSNEGQNARDVRVVVGQVLPDSPASRAGIQPGDEIESLTVGGTTYLISKPEQVSEIVSGTGEPITFSLIQNGEKKSIEVQAVSGLIEEDPARPAIGVATALIGVVSYSPLRAFAEALVTTGDNVVFIVVSLGTLIGSALTLTADVSQVAGPVGIASLAGEAAAFGLGSLLSFAALLSINLGIINLLPFPALDGGRLLFLGIESVTRKKIPVRVAGVLNTAGFGILILLMVAVTVGDVARLLG
ncbi:MAG: site-2 protease family protein [Patescibacteria group bacterium]